MNHSPKTLTFLVVGTLSALLLVTYFSPVRSFLYNEVNNRSFFQLRERLGAEPGLHPKIQIIALDTPTVDLLQRQSLLSEQWVKLLQVLHLQKAQKVLIDSLFPYPPESKIWPHEATREFNRLVGKLRPKVAAGVSLSSLFGKRTILPLDSPQTRFRNLFQQGSSPPGWLRESRDVPYGPHKDILSSFDDLGMVNWSDAGRATLIAKLKNLSTYFVHLGLHSSDQFKTTSQGLWVDGVQVPIKNDGSTLVNLLSISSFLNRSRPMAPFLYNDRVTKEQIFPPDSVVLVAPGMYTGGTDFKYTFTGKVPGALVVASIMNSALTGQWLHEFPSLELPLTLLLISLLTVIGMFCSPRLFITVTICLLTTVIVGSVLLFSYGNIVISWCLPTLFGVLAATSTATLRFGIVDHHQKMLHHDLVGKFGQVAIASLANSGELLQLTAKEQNLTIMFIDIAGFSKLATRLTAKEAFYLIKKRIGFITEIVHDHGGYVDRTLGDGVLCVFGYEFAANNVESHNHCKNALQCGLAIQRRNVELIQQKSDPYSLAIRIGIHSTPTFIGNLGSGGRIDLTVIGHGVNFSQRLESACGPHMVMLSETAHTMNELPPDPSWESYPRRITIKHVEQPLTAYEYNPHCAHPDRLKLALESCQATLGESLPKAS